MNYDPLAGDCEPQDPYRQYHGHPEAEQKRMAHLGLTRGTGAIAGANRTLGADVKQRQQGNVTREMQQLEKNLHALASVIDSLDSRLASACINAPETSQGLRGTDGGGCALANQLAAFNSMLSHQTTRIEMIYQGIDL
jgi:hypothetical protein